MQQILYHHHLLLLFFIIVIYYVLHVFVLMDINHIGFSNLLFLIFVLPPLNTIVLYKSCLKSKSHLFIVLYNLVHHNISGALYLLLPSDNSVPSGTLYFDIFALFILPPPIPVT
eukprot:213821_1